VITSVTLDILPEFRVDQRVYGGIPLAEFDAEAALRSADNVGALIDFGADQVELLYVRDRVDVDAPAPPAPPAEAYGGALVQGDVPAWESHQHMKTTSSGGWPNHLHFFMDDSLRDVPMPVLSLQTEYFVPLDAVNDALRALAPVAAAWPGWTTWDGANPTTQGPAHICELRSIAGDGIWLSPSNGADAASIHFTLGFYPDVAWQIVKEIEHALAGFGARPHWGKLWTKCPIDGYSKADDFKALRAELDPKGKFFTPFTARALGL
jgi:xylitol oxidase